MRGLIVMCNGIYIRMADSSVFQRVNGAFRRGLRREKVLNSKEPSPGYSVR